MAGKGGSGGAVLLGLVVALVAFAFYKNPDWLSGLTQNHDNPPYTGSGGNGRYVALGDSYTAAPNVGDSGGGPSGCHRSAENYPSDVARALRIGQFADASCSGATTADMFSPQQFSGENNPPQLDSLNSATTLVTVGIGGNDIGFISLVRGCVTVRRDGSGCRDENSAGGTDRLAARIDATAGKVAHVLSAISARAPNAQVLVVGYPTILPASGPGCWPFLPYGAPDVAYLRNVTNNLNGMLAEQASAAGATFVDTAAASRGHDVCAASKDRWVEGLVPTSAAAPMHPNADGEKATARAVLAAVG
jgi:lysophospholipase L1-like esterase